MRKIVVIISVIFTLMVTAEIPHKYYVGNTEVDRGFWHSIPDSILRQSASGKWDYDSLILEKLYLPMEYYLDSIDGKHIIQRRSVEVVALMKEQLMRIQQASSKKALRLQLGDSVPVFSVVTNPEGAIINDVINPEKCYLINFWATWCGNCLLELLPSQIPHLVEEFIIDKDFVFLPICIDSSLSELKAFFNSDRGVRWKHIEYVTALDKDRTANGIFAEPGHLPLTIVVGRDGRIKYLHMGRISSEEQYNELRKAIILGLKSSEKSEF